MITEKGLTGENISRQIFSYLDFSSLTNARMVSKIWNQFLTHPQQRSIWMDFLRKLESYLEYFHDACKSHELRQRLPIHCYLSWKDNFYYIGQEFGGEIGDIIDTFLTIQGVAAQ